MKIPRKVTPSPLVEAVADVRFRPAMPAGAVFGFVYGLIRERYAQSTALPIIQIPEQIRENDPNLLYQPHYRMENKPFILNLGPRLLNIAVVDGEYPGWSKFSDQIMWLFERLDESKVFDDIIRVGLRYINFFPDNVFERSNIALTLGERSLADENTLLRVESTQGDLSTVMQITNHGTLAMSDEPKTGSIVDLDIFYKTLALGERRPDTFRSLIDAAHDALKVAFFTVLKQDFLESLKPEYD
ncbi:MAG: TIGR04255 family protein [Thermodesulfobacteriota bacterium]